MQIYRQPPETKFNEPGNWLIAVGHLSHTHTYIHVYVGAVMWPSG